MEIQFFISSSPNDDGKSGFWSFTGFSYLTEVAGELS